MRRTGSIEIEGVGRGFSEQVKLHDADVFCTSRNPWSLRCHKEQLAKMKNHEEFSNSILFIRPSYAAVCILIRNLHQNMILLSDHYFVRVWIQMDLVILGLPLWCLKLS